MSECIVIASWIIALIALIPSTLFGVLAIKEYSKHIEGYAADFEKFLCFAVLCFASVLVFAYGISRYLPCITVVP